MSIAVTILLLLLGLGLIIKGGDIFVDASSWIARVFGIPPFIIGATIVSIATTMPEMLVSFMAAAEGKVDMAIGNAIGSVTVNTGLIMGLALVCLPMAIKRQDYLFKAIFMLGSTAILVCCGFIGSVGIAASIVLFIIFIVFMGGNVRDARRFMKQSQTITNADLAPPGSTEPKEKPIRDTNGKIPPKPLGINMIKFVLGAAMLVIGSRLLIDNGSSLATIMGVSERVIGVTIVAIGTSLPELVTTITAIAKKQASLSLGNVIGANIIDLTLILSICTFISGKTLPIATQSALVDLPACLLIGCMALIPALITKKFHRVQGIIMIVSYIAYLIYTATI